MNRIDILLAILVALCITGILFLITSWQTVNTQLQPVVRDKYGYLKQ